MSFQYAKHFQWGITTPKTSAGFPVRIYNSAALRVGGIIVVIGRHERDWPSTRVLFYNAKRNSWSVVNSNGYNRPGKELSPPVIGLVNSKVFLLDAKLPVVRCFDLVLRDWIPLEVKGVPARTHVRMRGFMESIDSFIFWDSSKPSVVSALDLERLEWSEQTGKGSLPRRGIGAPLTCYHGNTLFFASMESGRGTVLYLLSKKMMRFYWSKPKVGGFRPRHFYGATLTYSAGRLFRFGSDGMFGPNSLDVYIIKDAAWHKVSEDDASAEYTVQGLNPSANAHSAVALEDKLIAFGGFSLDFKSCRILQARPI